MQRKIVGRITALLLACILTLSGAVPNGCLDVKASGLPDETITVDELLSAENADEKLGEVPSDGSYADDSLIVGLDESSAGDLNEVKEVLDDHIREQKDALRAAGADINSIDDPAQIEQTIEELENISDAAEEVLSQVEEAGEDASFVTAEIPEGMEIEEAMRTYASLPAVSYVEPDIYLYEEDTNDTSFSEQWYLKALGAEAAWKYMDEAKASEVTVAVVDAGVNCEHEDLVGNIALDKCFSTNSDYLNPDTDADYSATSHGTHVSGVIAAVTGNTKGIAGLGNNKIKIAAMCAYSTVAKGIRVSTASMALDKAANLGIRVANISLGTTTYSETLEKTMQKAYDNGIIVVCSAGNKGVEQDHYPSDFPTTISVIATDKNNKRASYSNYGDKNFVSAPGSAIYSCAGDEYRSLSGTSMATPMVTATIADMISVNPTLKFEEVKEILKTTSYDLYEKGFDKESGWGLIQTDLAVAKAAGMAGKDPTGAASLDYVPPVDDKEDKPSETTDDPVKDTSSFDAPDSIESFVKRLYFYCLGRDAEESGLNYWSNELLSGNKNGGGVAYGFLFSKEFKKNNISDETYVGLLYRVFLGRDPDKEGRDYWLEKLKNGMSRQYVMNGFSASDEFKAICKKCNIENGTVPSSEARDINEGATAFVSRLYVKLLNRDYDVDGINYWCDKMLNEGMTPYDVVTDGFMHSDEFKNRNLSDAEFVAVLYRTFFDREYDRAGYDHWMKKLASGASRDEIAAGFADSREFAELMGRYGL